ncbi:MAG: Hpt domain-containing protein [Stagnimonas sp.]|nr:Hpt domain-containing protein [Stagnimonas sp.]
MPAGDLPRVPLLMANGLKWMRAEIDGGLHRVRLQLDQYQEDPEAGNGLREAVAELAEVEGALAMVRSFGAALLAGELRATVQDCLDGVTTRAEEALAAVSGATLQLSDYLDSLLLGQPDRAAVLQPVISELRLARGKPALTEADLFVRQMQQLDPRLPVPMQPARVEGNAGIVARKLLVPFQAVLLQWLKGQDSDDALSKLGKVAEQIAVNTTDSGVYLLWSSCAAATDSLRLHPRADALELKRWFGRMGQQMKLLAEHGERGAAGQQGEISWRLVGYAAALDCSGPRWQRLREALPLDGHLPMEPQLSEARRRLRGPNTRLLEKVTEEVRRDLGQIKDEIDLARRSGRISADTWTHTRDRTLRMSRTLALLGLSQLEQVLANQAVSLDQLTSEVDSVSEGRWMGLATALLTVEHSLENALLRPLRQLRPGAAGAAPELEEEVPHSRDLQDGIAALLREMLVDLAKLKTLLDAYLKDGQAAPTDEPAQLLNEVAAGLVMLDRERAAILAARLESWLRVAAFPRLRTDAVEAAQFAEAITGLEIYLEALRDGLPSTDRLLDELSLAIERLRFNPAEEAPDLTDQAESELLALLKETEDDVRAAEAGADTAPPPLAAAEEDPEIRDIFLEEAEEVRELLSRVLPGFQRAPDNPDTIAELRRAFHTLKGSGRMVGASQIGEVGWAVEHLLNRCVEGALPVNSAVVEVVERTLRLLPILLTEFRDGQGVELNSEAQALVEHAHFLASGRAPQMIDDEVLGVFREDALDRLAYLVQWLDNEPPPAVDDEAVRALHTIKGSAAVVNAEALSQLAAAFEQLLEGLRESALPLTPELRALLREAIPVFRDWVREAGKAELPPATDWLARVEAARSFLPPPGEGGGNQRRETFVTQAFEQLQGLEQGFAAWAAAATETTRAPELRQAAERLQELSREAGCSALALACDALAERLGRVDAATPDPAFFLRIGDALEELFQYLDLFRDGSLRDNGRALAERLRRLPTRVGDLAPPQPATAAPLPVEMSWEAPAPPEVELETELLAEAPAAAPIEVSGPVEQIEVIEFARPEPEPSAADADSSWVEPEFVPGPEAEPLPVIPPPELPLDPELAEIFQAEAAELFDDLREGLASWRLDGLQAPPEGLLRALHTLKGSSRMAGMAALGDVAHSLESRLNQVATGRQDGIATHAALLATVPVMEAAVANLPIAIEAMPREAIEMPPVEQEPVLLEESAPVSAEGLAVGEASLSAFEPDSAPVDPLPEAAAGFDPGPASSSEPVLDRFEQPATEFSFESTPVLEPDAPLPNISDDPALAPDTDGEALGAPAQRASRREPVQLDSEIDPELANIFVAEATEMLEAMDGALTAWSRDSRDEEAVRELQRALHTLKGGARMTGFSHMGDLAHDMETEVSHLSLRSGPPSEIEHGALRAQLEAMEHLHDALARGHYTVTVRESAPPVVEAPVEFEPAPMPEAVPLLPATAAAPIGWRPELFWKPEEDASQSAVRRELARVSVEALDAMLNEAGEISIYRSRLEQQNAALQAQLGEMTQTVVRLREQLRMLDIETEAQIVARGLSAAVPDQYTQDFDPLEMDRYSRMQELSRALAESVNDLASVQVLMDQVVDDAQGLLQQQGRINASVQQGLMSTLMVPFSRQVARLQRVVRQTAQEEGKYAEVVFSGVESELDRNVLERMTAPIEHLLRNAVVHGLESPEQRALAEKSSVGTVMVSLKREGTQLLMEIADDGKGLDFGAIRRKAIEQGLMPADAQLGDEDVAQFIFESGFSTASTLSQNAGRGVGTDVVASEVKQLGGSLELRSVPGKGTRFIIRLPLSLALSQALMVAVGHESYALPLTAIDGIARIPVAMLAKAQVEGALAFSYGGHDYRVRHLADLIDLPVTPPAADARTVPAVLVRLGEGLGGGERRAALIVDGLLGNREVVSKAVGPQLSSISGVAGATILPNGQVVLILDPAALIVDRARRKLIAEAAARAAAAEAADKDREGELIMVVDDSITMRRVAERLLLRQGFRVITAKDGLDAIAQLQTETPAAILLDIEMPRADGFEVAGFVRNTDRIAGVPIVMITSRSGEKHRARAASLGVNRYLIKPYQEDQLMSEVRSVLAEQLI